MHVLASWHHSALYALAVMFVFTATSHFNKMKHDLAQMIPSSFPRPLLIVYITRILELLGAAGLVLPQFRRLAGVLLIALLVGMFIANVNASTARRHTARQNGNSALVADSNADFVFTLFDRQLVSQQASRHRQADSKNFLICSQYRLTT